MKKCYRMLAQWKLAVATQDCVLSLQEYHDQQIRREEARHLKLAGKVSEDPKMGFSLETYLNLRDRD